MQKFPSLDLKAENSTFMNKYTFYLELKEKKLRKRNMKTLNIST